MSGETASGRLTLDELDGVAGGAGSPTNQQIQETTMVVMQSGTHSDTFQNTNIQKAANPPITVSGTLTFSGGSMIDPGPQNHDSGSSSLSFVEPNHAYTTVTPTVRGVRSSSADYSQATKSGNQLAGAFDLHLDKNTSASY